SQPTETNDLPPQPMAAQFSPPAQMPASVVKRKFPMTPIYAGAALMLLVVLVAPAGIMLIMNSSKAPPPTANQNRSSNSNSLARVPDLSFTTLDGGTQTLKDFRGRVVLLNVWATWTIPSREEIPVLNGLQQSFGSRGLTVLGVSSDDTVEKIKEFQKQIPQTYQVGVGIKPFDPRFSTTPLPTSYLIDRQGQISRKFVGRQSRETFEKAIQPLLNETP
ncbi:MAG TPA: TlpA disulfide reductase family protein, partial [Pyrinomonadaceae bacterium]|nr:TlpA disulfide reductase family protein [Pyrinomonadaceae bacterium]